MQPERTPERVIAAGPLAGVKVSERVSPHSSDPAAVAAAFAGMLAAGFGAEVEAIRARSDDPGESSLEAFLGRGKSIVAEASGETSRFLITDDPGVAARWHGPATVTVCSSRDGERHSELTLQAESGLLDVFGHAGEAPLPLPGHQIAYAGGMAAFDALAAAIYAHRTGRRPEPGTVSLVDVARWVNWKHYLAAYREDPDPGIGRSEEWCCVRCADGYVTLVFQDRDIPALERLTGDPFFARPELRNRRSRKPYAAGFRRAVERWTADRTRTEIVSLTSDARVPIGPVLELDELRADRQLGERAVFGREGRFPRLPVLFGGLPLGFPQAGQDDERLDAAQ